MSSYSTKIELLTDEFKTLVAWGADPRKLPALETLRELVPEAEKEVTYWKVGVVLRGHLVDAIDTLAGTYPFYGYQLDAHQLRRAYRVLFKIEATDDNVENRRWRAIKALKLSGQSHTPQVWRRRSSPERQLMRLLAEHMICGGGEIPK